MPTTSAASSVLEAPIFSVGLPIEPAAVVAALAAQGFREDDRVDEPGEFVLRGTVLDLFDPGQPLPLRIRTDANVVKSMTWYDPLTQLQTVPLRSYRLGDDAPGTDRNAEACAPAHTIDPLAPYGQTVRIGDLVVHEDHGLARIGSLRSIVTAEIDQEMIELEFRDETRRMLPVAEIAKLWRYGGDEGEVRLDDLNGSSWKTRRRKLDRAIVRTAKHMVRQAYDSAQHQVPTFATTDPAYDTFCNGFGYTPTADQARAFLDVEGDLVRGRAMNRLIAGDVGFGKTEVALRAAALVALGGAQTALVAPTNLLAAQHYALFQERFAPLGMQVALLTGAVKGKQRKIVLDGLADGSVHVVIGTGAVANPNIEFDTLGLVIVDEEHRLGTRDKNRLRAMSDGHVLQMSATPIPRTLMAAMVGLQDISVLATPPVARKPVLTQFHAMDEAPMRSAVNSELAAGGQVFVVVPRVADVVPMTERMTTLFPKAKTGSIHGQMPQNAMDRTITAFANGRHDILVSTTVIEIGLDVPRANCMIVHQADRFGLAQLHQLRGRVGRGDRQATMLMMSACHDAPETPAAKRLRKLVAEARLGAGFSLSLADLDMRGGGDLAGDSQNGHIALVGADLYHDLLETTIGDMAGVAGVAQKRHAGITAPISCSLPEDWLPRPDSRLEVYYRIAHARAVPELENLRSEFSDRFGAPPAEMRNLLDLREAALRAAENGLATVTAGSGSVKLVTQRSGRKREKTYYIERVVEDPKALIELVASFDRDNPLS